MKTTELRLDNWVDYKGHCRVCGYNDGKIRIGADWIYPNEVDPIPITPERLLKNGWRKQTELTYYKKLDKIRLGWQEGGVLIVGWTEWPKKIESVHQLQNILADLGYEEQANNFKI